MKRFVFTLGRWIVVVRIARLRWRLGRWESRYTTERSFYLGPITIEIEDWTAEVYPVCAQCDSPQIGEVSCGDEGWTVCQDCRSVEQGYRYVNLREWESL